LKSDDQREFDEFYRSAYPMLYRKTARLTQGHKQQTEDLVAEVCLRALQKWDVLRVHGDQRRTGWLFVTLTYVIREQRRTQARRPAPQPLPDADPGSDVADRAAGVPERTGMRIAHATVAEACERVLAGSQYEVVMMRLLGFGHKEIAVMRGTSPGTVRKQVADGLQALREDPKVKDVLAQLREGGEW
jgi:RNA polymerase sigma factor (sigma-70 family)